MRKVFPVGRISYSNVLPVFHFFEQERDPMFEFITDVPTVLNQKLADGELVAGAISAFSFAANAHKYYALSGLSVSSQGSVGSILLFSKKRIEDLDGSVVALPDTSETSVNLLKVILRERYRITVNYVTQRPNLEEMMLVADASLLIGDDALQWSLLKNEDFFVYDLGEEWYEYTGLSMTYALWAIRRDFVANYPDVAENLHRKLLNSKVNGILQMDKVIQRAIQLYGRDKTFWKSYFGKLIHNLDDDILRGAESYFTRVHDAGLLSQVVHLEMWGEKHEFNRHETHVG